jgi:hypothetical protein
MLIRLSIKIGCLNNTIFISLTLYGLLGNIGVPSKP